MVDVGFDVGRVIGGAIGLVVFGDAVLDGDKQRALGRRVFIDDVNFDVMVMVHVGRLAVGRFLRILAVLVIDFRRAASDRFTRHRDVAGIVDVVNCDRIKFVRSLLNRSNAAIKLTVANLHHLLGLIGWLGIHV